MKGYNDELARLLCFVLRVKTSLYPMELPTVVVSAMRAFLNALGNEMFAIDALLAPLQTLLMALWTYYWPQSQSTKETTDPSLIFLACRCSYPIGGFKDAVGTTPLIARLFYCMRLVFSRHMIVLLRQDPTIDLMNIFDELQDYLTEKKPYTFNSLLTLQHYATAAAMNQQGFTRIEWIDRKHYTRLLYMGDEIQFDKLLELFRHLETELKSLWETKLMLDTGLWIDWMNKEFLAEDLTNQTPGYSLFSDARNNCFSNKLGLISAILTTPALSSRFLSGFDIKSQRPKWNPIALRSWLYDYSRFHLLLAIRWLMLGGSPMRGTELVSCLFQNTPTRTRSLVAIAEHIAIVNRYSKTTALTGFDKLIPHAGDRFTSDLTIQDGALARPFARLAASICYPNQPLVTEAYRDLLFVNQGRVFNAEEISTTMIRISSSILGVRLGLNAHRHVAIAFRRMLVDHHSEADTETELMRRIEAEQAGHTERVEEIKYAVSSLSMGNYSDQMLGLFCNASKKWQIKCQVIPTGVRLNYKESLAQFYSSHLEAGLFEEEQTEQSKVEQLVQNAINRMEQTVIQLGESLAEQILAKLNNFSISSSLLSTSNTFPAATSAAVSPSKTNPFGMQSFSQAALATDTAAASNNSFRKRRRASTNASSLSSGAQSVIHASPSKRNRAKSPELVTTLPPQSESGKSMF